MALVKCEECGRDISSEAQACPACGKPTVHGSKPVRYVAKKNRGIAIMAAVLLGGLGVHKFYLDRPGQGLLYLLFCWTFVPAILGLLEGISYALIGEWEFQKQYGSA